MSNGENKPIGIMSEYIWKQKRAEELTGAIFRYVYARQYQNAERIIIAWCHELEGLVRDLETDQHQQEQECQDDNS